MKNNKDEPTFLSQQIYITVISYKKDIKNQDNDVQKNVQDKKVWERIPLKLNMSYGESMIEKSKPELWLLIKNIFYKRPI